MIMRRVIAMTVVSGARLALSGTIDNEESFRPMRQALSVQPQVQTLVLALANIRSKEIPYMPLLSGY